MSKHEYQFDSHLTTHDVWKELKRLEEIEIIHAGLCGSRGCGLASDDSDYDIRFIYARPLTHYVYARHRENAIRAQLGGTHDFQGLDLNRALKLVVESNQTAFEMLYGPRWESPEIAKGSFLPKLQGIFELCYRPEVFALTAMKSANSYFDGEFNDVKEDQNSKIKRLLHSIRLSTQALYTRSTGQVPPVMIGDLMAWLGDVSFEVSRDAWTQDVKLSLQYLKLWTRIRERYEDVEGHRIPAPHKHHHGEVTELVEEIFSVCFK